MLSNMGVPSVILFLNLVLFGGVIYILYLVISKAVKDGVNKSVVGQFIEEKEVTQKDHKSLNERELHKENN